jgi:hypothetical protein
MGTVMYRPDYAKFLMQVRPELWSLTSRRFHEASHLMKVKGDWLKSHRMTRLWFNHESGYETWSIEIWGEWAQIVDRLPMEYLATLKRFDVRAILWDTDEATIIEVGQHLQKNLSQFNVNVYSTKPRSKRDGRDSGGKGFAIGSHKSDLRITTYKRTGEPCAQEYQCSGALLNRHVTDVMDICAKANSSISAWAGLVARVVASGERRMEMCFRLSGLGTSWPTFENQASEFIRETWPDEDYIAPWDDTEQQSYFGDDAVLPGDEL